MSEIIEEKEILNDDFKQFQDEVLKGIKEFEEDVMRKVTTKMTDLNVDYKKFHLELKNISDQNKKLMELMTNKNIYLEKIPMLEQFKNKVDGMLITQEIRINNNINELSSMRNKYDSAILENSLVSGYVGPSCQYKNVGEFILYAINEIARQRSEKEILKNAFKELKIKTEASIKSIINLNETIIRRSQDYTDTRIKDFKDLVYQKINYMDTKGKEVKLIAKFFKEEQESYEKNKDIFRNELKEEFLSETDMKINELKENNEKEINKLLYDNHNSMEYLKHNIDDKIKDLKIRIKENKEKIGEIQNKFKKAFNDEKDISTLRKMIQQHKKNRTNSSLFPMMSASSSQKNNVATKKLEDRDNSNNKANTNFNEENEFDKKNKNLTNSNNLKSTEPKLKNCDLNGIQLNELIKPKKLVYKKILPRKDKDMLEFYRKSVESASNLRKKDYTNILSKHKNSKLLILNYRQNNHNNLFSIKNFRSISNGNNNSMKKDYVIDCGVGIEKSPEALIDGLQIPDILEKRILSNKELKINGHSSHRGNIKKLLNYSGDFSHHLMEYHQNISPEQKLSSHRTMGNWKEICRNWKCEKSIRLKKLEGENNLAIRGVMTANKKQMNQHIFNYDYPNSFSDLYNAQLNNKNQ